MNKPSDVIKGSYNASHPWGLWSGPGGIRTLSLFSAIEARWVSIESIPCIWWLTIRSIPTCGGIHVQEVLIFHAVLPALQQVAAGMKQGKQARMPTPGW
jgi:hypothetical protein